MARQLEEEARWRGYYDGYHARAARRNLTTVELLDDEWFDGRTTAEIVLPFLSRDSVVLEIACGLGRVARFVAPHCKHLYCTDILDEALAGARTTLHDAANVSFVKINGFDLAPFADNSFDVVYSFTTFFHFDFELVVQYVAEIRRVLNRGGKAILEFKRWQDREDVDQLLEKIASAGGTAAYAAKLDKWRYVSKELLKLLCDYYELDVVDDNLTRYTFAKRTTARTGPA